MIHVTIVALAARISNEAARTIPMIEKREKWKKLGQFVRATASICDARPQKQMEIIRKCLTQDDEARLLVPFISWVNLKGVK